MRLYGRIHLDEVRSMTVKYLEALAASAATILEPFGYDESRVKDLLGKKAQADKWQ